MLLMSAVDLAYNIGYLIIWILLAVIIFKVLRATRIERAFEQGRIFEIRLAYFLLTLILSFISTEAIFKIINLFRIN